MQSNENTTTETQQYDSSAPAQEDANPAERDSISLSNCKPAENSQSLTSRPSASKIRRPNRDEPFTTVADPAVIACIVDRKRDSWGNAASEEYYPVIGELQSQVGSATRSIAFHPCATASGETFIYPQKLDPPNAWANSWNASLAQALGVPPGQWRTVWSDKQAECYKHELVDSPMEGIPEYPDFQEHLEQALTPNIITSLHHPVLQQLLGQHENVNDDEEIY